MGNSRRHWRAAGAMALLVTVLPACANLDTEGDKAGSRSAVVLRMAQSGYGPTDAMNHFIDSVAALSGGEVEILPINAYGAFAPDAEVQLVRGVAAGEVDLGWVSAASFDSTGATSLEALSAPFLLHSYAAENAVLASPLADRLLAGLDAAGVTGLSVSAGALQMPVSVEHALLRPSDWKGLTVGTYQSVVMEQTIRALGATPYRTFGDPRARALDAGVIQAFPFGFPGYSSGDLPTKAPYVASNVRLWMNPAVTFANPERLAGLSRQQHDWLVQAADETERYAAALFLDQTQAIETSCELGGHLVQATPAELAALRRAVDSVYVTLEADPETRSAIAEIRQIAATTPAEPESPLPSACSRG